MLGVVRSKRHVCAGLDARAAAVVIRVVRNIVNTGRTIVCMPHNYIGLA